MYTTEDHEAVETCLKHARSDFDAAADDDLTSTILPITVVTLRTRRMQEDQIDWLILS